VKFTSSENSFVEERTLKTGQLMCSYKLLVMKFLYITISGNPQTSIILLHTMTCDGSGGWDGACIQESKE
jgi:hypothetical protein